MATRYPQAAASPSTISAGSCLMLQEQQVFQTWPPIFIGQENSATSELTRYSSWERSDATAVCDRLAALHSTNETCVLLYGKGVLYQHTIHSNRTLNTGNARKGGSIN